MGALAHSNLELKFQHSSGFFSGYEKDLQHQPWHPIFVFKEGL